MNNHIKNISSHSACRNIRPGVQVVCGLYFLEANMYYHEQLKTDAWKTKRNAILERDDNRCRYCGTSIQPLHVHHLIYFDNFKAWEYDDKYLITLCDNCHSNWHKIKNRIDEMCAVNLDRLKKIAKLIYNG